MIPLALLTLGQGGQLAFREFRLRDAVGKPSRLYVIQPMGPRKGGPKLSPRAFGDPPQQWEFDYVTTGFVPGPLEDAQRDVRFRVFSQNRQEVDDPAVAVTRMLLRLWDLTRDRMRLDHNPLYRNGVMDVYLSYGGIAGGEQRFDVDYQPESENQRQPAKVNTIYIYDLKSFTDPTERAREVAHEYGHAILPPVGGFERPEEWANGHLGERLYLRWIRDELKLGRLEPADVMGMNFGQADRYVTRNVDPLADAAALQGPREETGGGKGPAAMDAYLGAALWLSETLPLPVFARAMKLNGDLSPKGFVSSSVLATAEPETFEVKIPPRLAGKPVFLPVGGLSITGAKVIAKRPDGWAKLMPTGGPLRISR